MVSRSILAALTGAAFLSLSGAAFATGLATCDSGDQSKWKSQDQLKAQLEKEGYEVRRIKIDGGCYEAYVIDSLRRHDRALLQPAGPQVHSDE